MEATDWQWKHITHDSVDYTQSWIDVSRNWTEKKETGHGHMLDFRKSFTTHKWFRDLDAALVLLAVQLFWSLLSCAQIE